MESLKTKLEVISDLESKYGVLGVSFYTDKDTSVTTVESADIVVKLLQTVGKIKSGELKFKVPNFALLESINVV